MIQKFYATTNRIFPARPCHPDFTPEFNLAVSFVYTGLLFFAHVLLHSFAISLTKVAYMISVKRLSVIIGLIYGGVIFKEKNLATRTIGTLLIVAGAVVITLWGR